MADLLIGPKTEDEPINGGDEDGRSRKRLAAWCDRPP